MDFFAEITEDKYSYLSQVERRCELKKNISFINLLPKKIKGFRILYGRWF